MKKGEVRRQIIMAIVLFSLVSTKIILAKQLDKIKIEKAMVRAIECQQAHSIFTVSQTGIARVHKTTKTQIF